MAALIKASVSFMEINMRHLRRDQRAAATS
jgi:hypothetical protein